MSEVMCYVRHARQLRQPGQSDAVCSRGIRAWFKHHQLDFTKFLVEGIPASAVENLDAYGKQVATLARREADMKGRL